MEHDGRELTQNGNGFESAFSIRNTVKFLSLSCVPAFPGKLVVFVSDRFFSGDLRVNNESTRALVLSANKRSKY